MSETIKTSNPVPTPRRDFLKTAALAGTGIVAAATQPNMIRAAPPRSEKPETLVAALYRSLTEEQRRTVTFEFNHPLQFKVDNNWRITKPRIGDFLPTSSRP